MGKSANRWSASTKRIIVVILLVLLALVVYRFRIVIAPLMIAFLLAFILDPIADFLEQRVRLPRGLATTLVFLVLILGLLGILAAPAAFISRIREALDSIPDLITGVIDDVGAFFQRPLVIWEYSLDLSEFYTELSSMLRSFVTSVAEGTVDIAVGVASGAFWLIFILMAAFYLVKDADRLTDNFDQLFPPGYRDDVIQLRREITMVWNAFLRGQLLLGLAMAAVTMACCWLFGVSYAVPLGLLAGVMEFVPSIGPIIAAVPAVLVALFQPSAIWGLSNFWYAVIIAAVYIGIQQIEGNVLIPRILGRSLNLHPLLVLIAIIIGGSLAGILGMLLSAPVLATLRVVGRYVFCRLYDRDPFLASKAEPLPKPGILRRVVAWARLRRQARKARLEQARRQEQAGSDEEGEEQDAASAHPTGPGGG